MPRHLTLSAPAPDVDSPVSLGDDKGTIPFKDAFFSSDSDSSEVSPRSGMEDATLSHNTSGLASWNPLELGEPGTLQYRMLLAGADSRQLVSPWHSVPLYSSQTSAAPSAPSQGLLNFVCKTPAGCWTKLEVAEKEALAPLRLARRNGAPGRYLENAPWNYGMLPQTYADPEQGNEDYGFLPSDGSPIEVIDVGSKTSRAGEVYPVKPLAIYALVTQRATGPVLAWKVLAIAADDRMADNVNDIEDVERRLPGTSKEVREWLRKCDQTQSWDSKHKFGLNERALGQRELAEVVARCHADWQLLSADLGPLPKALRQVASAGAASREKLEKFWRCYSSKDSREKIPLSDPNDMGNAVLDRAWASLERNEVGTGERQPRQSEQRQALQAARTPHAALGRKHLLMEVNGKSKSRRRGGPSSPQAASPRPMFSVSQRSLSDRPAWEADSPKASKEFAGGRRRSSLGIESAAERGIISPHRREFNRLRASEESQTARKASTAATGFSPLSGNTGASPKRTTSQTGAKVERILEKSQQAEQGSVQVAAACDPVLESGMDTEDEKSAKSQSHRRSFTLGEECHFDEQLALDLPVVTPTEQGIAGSPQELQRRMSQEGSTESSRSQGCQSTEEVEDTKEDSVVGEEEVCKSVGQADEEIPVAEVLIVRHGPLGGLSSPGASTNDSPRSPTPRWPPAKSSRKVSFLETVEVLTFRSDDECYFSGPEDIEAQPSWLGQSLTTISNL